MHGMTARARGVYSVGEHHETDPDWHEVLWWDTYHADAAGRFYPERHHWYRWHLFICNNSDCPFDLRVREDRLVEFVTTNGCC